MPNGGPSSGPGAIGCLAAQMKRSLTSFRYGKLRPPASVRARHLQTWSVPEPLVLALCPITPLVINEDGRAPWPGFRPRCYSCETSRNPGRRLLTSRGTSQFICELQSTSKARLLLRRSVQIKIPVLRAKRLLLFQFMLVRSLPGYSLAP